MDFRYLSILLFFLESKKTNQKILHFVVNILRKRQKTDTLASNTFVSVLYESLIRKII